MIVPMKKVSLIIMGDKRSDTLQKLRRLGILHIEAVEGSGKKLEELKEKTASLEAALFGILEKKTKKTMPQDIGIGQAVTVSEEINTLLEEKKLCSAEKLALTAELDRISGWGELSPESLEALSAKGVDISLYEMPKAEYALLDEKVKTLSIKKTRHSVKFLLIRSGAEGEEEVISSLKSYRFELPEFSTAELKQ